MRGVALMSAVTLVVEIGDFGRFTSLPQLMTWLDLVPKEHSSGGKVRSHLLHQWVMILAAPDDGSVVIRLADGKVMEAD
ncbi:MAG: transposase [Janthinobacterium lividum]